MKNRDQHILEILPMVESFAKQNCRGDADVYEEIKSRLIEVLVRRLSSRQPINDIEHYFKSTFKSQVGGFFHDRNEQEKKDRAVTVVDYGVSNEATYNLLLDDVLGSDSLTPEEKELVQLKISGLTEHELCKHFNVSIFRLRAVMIKLGVKIKALIT